MTSTYQEENIGLGNSNQKSEVIHKKGFSASAGQKQEKKRHTDWEDVEVWGCYQQIPELPKQYTALLWLY